MTARAAMQYSWQCIQRSCPGSAKNKAYCLRMYLASWLRIRRLQLRLGRSCSQTGEPSRSTVTVASEAAVLLTVSHATVREVLAKFMPLGDPSTDPTAAAAAAAALRRCQPLAGLGEAELRQVHVLGCDLSKHETGVGRTSHRSMHDLNTSIPLTAAIPSQSTRLHAD